MSQQLNHYKADLRDFQFLLFEQFRLQELLGKPPFDDWGSDEVKLVLDEVYRYACEVAGPLNRQGDAQGCRLVDGRVKTPDGFKDAYKRLYEAGWRQLAVSPEFGGQGAPTVLRILSDELLNGANTSLANYSGLTIGAAELIQHFGTQEQRALFCERMYQGVWAGTMCLTEPHAGSDVGAATTSAKRHEDGSYRIKGTKIFITSGDHDLTDNIVHMVLARVEGAPAGTKGLSLFIVPAVRVKEDGTLGERNDLETASIEHKMGINGSATCVLNFGDNDACVGYLVGTEENQGIRQMFQMMNEARIMVGVQGYAAASSAYLNALEYAKERKQGAAVEQRGDPNAPRVPIIQHPDVRRMLLDMKARLEGIRALAVYLGVNLDRMRASDDEDERAFCRGQVEVLTPLLKAYATDQGFQVCVNAIQTYGGAGFLRDHPVEQYCRDAKIFSIYEGTNHIQALDLVGRKLRLAEGRYVREYLGAIERFVAARGEEAEFSQQLALLAEAEHAVKETVEQLRKTARDDEAFGPLVANSVLEMLAELSVAWLLLEGAVVARDNKAKLPDGHKDHDFYAGKLYAARYFANQILPGVVHKAAMIERGDRAALEMPDAAFGTL